MVNVSIVNKKGHEKFVNLSPEEARQLIDKTIEAEGQRYFIIDEDTQTLLKEIKLQPNQNIVLIPIVGAG